MPLEASRVSSSQWCLQQSDIPQSGSVLWPGAGKPARFSEGWWIKGGVKILELK